MPFGRFEQMLRLFKRATGDRTELAHFDLLFQGQTALICRFDLIAFRAQRALISLSAICLRRRH